jgi:hypothetical protein
MFALLHDGCYIRSVSIAVVASRPMNWPSYQGARQLRRLPSIYSYLHRIIAFAFVIVAIPIEEGFYRCPWDVQDYIA